jgi:hypothetical protein
MADMAGSDSFDRSTDHINGARFGRRDAPWERGKPVPGSVRLPTAISPSTIMGQLRFAIPRPERLSPGAMTRAYVAGMDGIPWECRRTSAEGVLTIERDVRESGNLYFPWLVRAGICSAASLMDRDVRIIDRGRPRPQPAAEPDRHLGSGGRRFRTSAASSSMNRRPWLAAIGKGLIRPTCGANRSSWRCGPSTCYTETIRGR